jgi:hypothetical protein
MYLSYVAHETLGLLSSQSQIPFRARIIDS